MTRTFATLCFATFTVGCASDPGAGSACEEGDGACFADASDDELVAATNAGLGMTMIVPWLSGQMAVYDRTFNVGDPCPASTVDGDLLVLTGTGCTGEVSGAVWEGELAWRNPPVMTVVDQYGDEMSSSTVLGLESDPDRPTEMSFDDWTFTTIDGGLERTRVVNGTVYTSAASSEPMTMSSDLEYSVDGGPASILRAEYACTPDETGFQLCETVSSEGEVEGLGTFDVIQVLDDDGLAVEVLLEGRDTLSLAGADESGCINLNDQTSYCQDDAFPNFEAKDGPVDEGELALFATGFGVMTGGGEGTFMPSAFVVGEGASRVEVFLHDTLAPELGTEVHDLTEEDPSDDDEGSSWRAEIETDRSYKDGVRTAMPVADADHLVLQFRLYDAEGALVSCAFDSREVEDPQSWFDTSACPRID